MRPVLIERGAEKRLFFYRSGLARSKKKLLGQDLNAVALIDMHAAR